VVNFDQLTELVSAGISDDRWRAWRSDARQHNGLHSSDRCRVPSQAVDDEAAISLYSQSERRRFRLGLGIKTLWNVRQFTSQNHKLMQSHRTRFWETGDAVVW
jgi:hypothetical protein